MRYQLWQFLYIHILSSGACKNSQSSSFLLSRVRCEGTFTRRPITRFMEVHQNDLSPLLKAFLSKGNTILPIISDGVFVKQSKMQTITPTAGPSIKIYRVVFLLVRPIFSTKKKNKLQPTRTSFSRMFQC